MSTFRTDWARVDALTDAEIEAAVRDDPDAVLLDDAFFESAELVHPVKKERITIRLDSDVLAFLRSEGPGYQTRISNILRAYVRLKGRRIYPRKGSARLTRKKGDTKRA